MSLTDKIRSATSKEEVQALLKQGETYASASPKTRRRWQTWAKEVISQLK